MDRSFKTTINKAKNLTKKSLKNSPTLHTYMITRARNNIQNNYIYRYPLPQLRFLITILIIVVMSISLVPDTYSADVSEDVYVIEDPPIPLVERIYITEYVEVEKIVEVDVVEIVYIREPIAVVCRSKPIYEVYKNNYWVNVPTEIQWLVRDLAIQFDYPEQVLFGMILKESTFNPNTVNPNGPWVGLAQMIPGWRSASSLSDHRITDNHSSRNMLDPEHNLLTMIELWEFARHKYDLDPWTEEGIRALLYWHYSGNIRETSYKIRYANDVFRFARELIPLQEGLQEIFDRQWN